MLSYPLISYVRKMLAQKSTLYRDALESYKEISALLGIEILDECHDGIFQQVFHTYLQDLSLLMSAEITTKQRSKRFEKIQQKFEYGLLGYLDMLVAGGKLDEEKKKAVEDILPSFLERQSQCVLFRKKIVVLTTSAGTGHLTAAKSIKRGIERKYGHDYNVVILDISVEYHGLYESMITHTPFIYKWLFESTDTKESTSLLHDISYPLIASKLDHMLERERPDLIVSTFNFFGLKHWIQKSLRKRKKYIPIIFVITDSISIHQGWMVKGVDHFVVANEDTRQVIVEKGISQKKAHALGFPVDPSFYNTTYDRDTELRKEGLDPEKLTFLVTANTGATMKDVEFTKTFHKRFGDKAQCMVVLSKNEKLLKKLKKEPLGPSVKLYGWVDDMARMMHISDVVAIKAGGASVMEAVAIKKPMILYKVFPGQEEGNALLTEKNKLGFVMNKKEKILDIMEQYIADPKLVAKQKKNFAKVTIPNATEKVAEFVVDVVNKGK